MKQRPLVVELLGPAGAGKSALLASLAARDRSVRVDLGMWRLPRLLLLVCGVQLFTTILGLFRAARCFLWEEGKRLIKLQALHYLLRSPRSKRYRVVVLDEGPLFILIWLRGFAHQAATNSSLASWWPRALKRWARAVDMTVWLDAPDPVLAQRIRTRAHDHPVKDKSDAEISEFLARYRAASARVLSDLETQHGPTVLSVRTDQGSPAEIVDQLLAAFQRDHHGH